MNEKVITMTNTRYQTRVDDLITHFWKNGYLTVSRKYGKFLPEPKPIGEYEVDAVGKLKKKFAVGILLSEEDLNNPKIYSKLNYLATRQTKYSNKQVTLFVGVPKGSLNKARVIVSGLENSVKKNIKLIGVDENKIS